MSFQVFGTVEPGFTLIELFHRSQCLKVCSFVEAVKPMGSIRKHRYCLKVCSMNCFDSDQEDSKVQRHFIETKSSNH